MIGYPTIGLKEDLSKQGACLTPSAYPNGKVPAFDNHVAAKFDAIRSKITAGKPLEDHHFTCMIECIKHMKQCPACHEDFFNSPAVVMLRELLTK